jgi:hypothetical protein
VDEKRCRRAVLMRFLVDCSAEDNLPNTIVAR